MSSILVRLSILTAISLGLVSASRDGEDQQAASNRLEVDTQRAASNRLEVENTVLRDEVTELRAELRVAASGSFTRERQASSSASTPGLGSDVHNHNVAKESEAHGPLATMEAARLAAEAAAEAASHKILSVDLQDISQAIADDAASVARTMNATPAKAKPVQANMSMNGSKVGKVLFVIYSSSRFYDTRLKWARETWAKNLPAKQLVVIGDGQASLPGVNIHQTRCKPADHTMTMCCKYAEAVIVAQTIMWQNPELEWVYLADDDAYIRTAALEKNLLSQPQSYPRDRGLVLGTYGCATANCGELMCGGAGYAANRWAIDILAAGDPAGFVQDMMRTCNRCGGSGVENKGKWGDAGLSEVVKDRGMEQRTLDGLYGWLLDKSCLEFSLESDKEPLMYHMIRSQPQMDMLHRLFAPVEEQTGSSLPAGSNTALDGLGGCVEFRGNVQCAASRDEEDRPWHRGKGLCQHPRMPRLPVLLGVFTLVLLFGIMVIFIWAGLRYRQWEGVSQWDGWKLQGLKWHNYPLQGRSSRFR